MVNSDTIPIIGIFKKDKDELVLIRTMRSLCCIGLLCGRIRCLGLKVERLGGLYQSSS